MNSLHRSVRSFGGYSLEVGLNFSLSTNKCTEGGNEEGVLLLFGYGSELTCLRFMLLAWSKGNFVLIKTEKDSVCQGV